MTMINNLKEIKSYIKCWKNKKFKKLYRKKKKKMIDWQTRLKEKWMKIGSGVAGINIYNENSYVIPIS